MATQKPNLWGLLSDSFGVIKSHPLHFLALAALFFFPNTLLAIIYLFLVYKPPVPPSFHRSLLSVYSPEPQNGFLIPILYMIVSLLLGCSATAATTYTASRIYYGKPVKFVLSLKSILVSTFPLLVTELGITLIFILIIIGLGLLAFLAYSALSLLGLVIDYGSASFIVFISVIGALYFLALIYLHVKWFLAEAIVVVENEWGLKPLKRSSALVKGMQGVVLSTLLLLLIPNLVLSSGYYCLFKSAMAGGISWILVVSMIVYAGVLTPLSLYGMVVRAVLLAYCKNWHGEIAKSGQVYYTRLPRSITPDCPGEDEV